MTEEEIRLLAAKESKLTFSELNAKIAELKSLNCGILQCIIYVRVNQDCSLYDAKTIVVNSPAWIDKKDEFIRHQEEQTEEFLEAAKDDIESIQHIYTPEKTEVYVTIKPKTK